MRGTVDGPNRLLQPLAMGYQCCQTETCGPGALALCVFARTRKEIHTVIGGACISYRPPFAAFCCLEYRMLLSACWVPPKQLHIQFYLPGEMALILIDTLECAAPEMDIEMLTLLSEFSADALR
jgi:hypothetical protein